MQLLTKKAKPPFNFLGVSWIASSSETNKRLKASIMGRHLDGKIVQAIILAVYMSIKLTIAKYK